jgi:S-adenosylmethionine:tRNA ribosyltransferase-isomerase
VTEENPQEHIIHTEWCELPYETADLINKTRKAGGRIIAVGTTSVRTLESAAVEQENVLAHLGPTSLFILPGYQFKVVDAMITNFHLPKSTLLMLVSAFAGREKILETYGIAIREGYRFYSFGDAMIIL